MNEEPRKICAKLNSFISYTGNIMLFIRSPCETFVSMATKVLVQSVTYIKYLIGHLSNRNKYLKNDGRRRNTLARFPSILNQNFQIKCALKLINIYLKIISI